MTRSPRFPHVVMACIATCMAAGALEVRSYDADLHDRFVNFPEDPAFNPGFLYDAPKLSGIGWEAANPGKQYALVTPRHAVFAAHHAPAVGTAIQFLGTGGGVVERNVSRVMRIGNPSGSSSDLALITLSEAIGRDEGIAPLPYLNLPSEEDYHDLDLIVLGSEARAGHGKLTGFRTINVNWFVSRTFHFDYHSQAGGTGDARLAGGDSGSPTLVDVGGSPALLGVHLATSNSADMQSNFDASIPYYVGEIDELIEADGYRMRPLHATASDLGCSLTLPSRPARQGKPLALGLTLAGSAETGNLEVVVRFPEGMDPDTLAGGGWIIAKEGDAWRCRRASITTSSTIVVGWNSAPLAPVIDLEVDWSSDSSPEDSAVFPVKLHPSFASWAASQGTSGQTSDPDRDGRDNLTEYAFGSDPLVSDLPGADGTPAAPVLEIKDDRVVYRHPERADKSVRGLVYTVEWSERLDEGGWTPVAPTGTTFTYADGTDGFVERTVSWKPSGGRGFVRLRISESE